jgi:hypothetical protein
MGLNWRQCQVGWLGSVRIQMTDGVAVVAAAVVVAAVVVAAVPVATGGPTSLLEILLDLIARWLWSITAELRVLHGFLTVFGE